MRLSSIGVHVYGILYFAAGYSTRSTQRDPRLVRRVLLARRLTQWEAQRLASAKLFLCGGGSKNTEGKG